MDIRNFLVSLKRKKPAPSGSSDSEQEEKPETRKEVTKTGSDQLLEEDCGANLCQDLSQDFDVESEDCHENDIGRVVGRASTLLTEQKKQFLEHCWIPPRTYDFAADATHLKRKFNFEWLEMYSPWLAYSRRQKGAFCKYCTLFPPKMSSVRGVLGSFIIRPFSKYQKAHECFKNHMKTHFHKEAVEAARQFLENVPVDVQINKYCEKTLKENRKIIASIISCITFCGSHDLALRGKYPGEGVLEGLMKLRIDAGDQVLQNHVEHAKKNATYKSPDIQNEIITICGNVIKNCIISKAKESVAYSILADETADISGAEQLSIGLRFFNEEIQEAFVGFVQLKALDAKSIAETIDEFVSQHELDPEKCVGLGFDGCSVMSGKEGGVQAILRRKYKKALFFHCASHKLNLVINDLNALPCIRNTVGTVKDIISFFRESVLRRNLIPNIARLCETRWSEKHKSIRLFKEHFIHIMEALEQLACGGNDATRKNAFQLHAAASSVGFIISLVLISKYAAIIEPVVNALQSVSLDTVKASEHIKRILELLRSHRENPEMTTEAIFNDSAMICDHLDIDVNAMQRMTARQKHRSNHPAETPSEYWKRSLVIPYLDSIISSLELRFAEENTPAFMLSKLHPVHLVKASQEELNESCKMFSEYYHLDNLENEVELWQNLWLNKSQPLHELSLLEVLKESETFFPAIQKALKILITLPCTTCTVERSFSTLRRIKTWLRSTMSENRLNGLAMMSVHRKIIFENFNAFVDKVVEKFAENPRKLCFN